MRSGVMKATGVMVGLHILFAFIHGFEDVSITCSEYWLQVKIKRRPYFNYQQVQPYELYLGTGCTVTGGLLDFFEFVYPLSSCGIKTEVRAWGILIESSITYEPANLDISGHLPISCYIQRKFTFTFGKKVKRNNSHGSKKSVGKKNSTSRQVKNSETHPGVTVGNSGSHTFYPSRLSIGMKL